MELKTTGTVARHYTRRTHNLLCCFLFQTLFHIFSLQSFGMCQRGLWVYGHRFSLSSRHDIETQQARDGRGGAGLFGPLAVISRVRLAPEVTSLLHVQNWETPE